MNITWDRIEREEWEALTAAAGRSNLLQSWAYGAAKQQVEGWRPRRAVLTAHGRPVAIAQVLERRLGPTRIARLNRGPLWLVPPTPADWRDALARIAAPWRAWRLGALFLAPELPAGAEADAILGALRCRRRGAPAWCSAWLGLDGDEAALRRNLKGKWRNMLVSAEKAGLDVTAMPVEQLLADYARFMEERRFTGVPPAIVAAMAAHAWRPDDLRALAAVPAGGGASVGGVLMARHGDAATYLIGWNNDEGRRLKAGNLLLWQGALAARRDGCRWFDLGGIDDVLTPGIAAFKRGLNGEEYRLAGEFLRL